MHQDRPCWNTYDPLGLNRIVRFPELYEIRISVFCPESHSYTSKLYFLEHLGDVGNVLRTGAHSPDCSYASADLSFAGFMFRIEYAVAHNGALSCLVTPLSVADPSTLVIVEVLRAWDLDGKVELDSEDVISFPSETGGAIKVAAEQNFSSVHCPGKPVASGVYHSEEELAQSLVERKTLNAAGGRAGIAALGFLARIPLRISSWEEKIPRETSDKLPGLVQIATNISEAKRSLEQESAEIHGGPFDGCYRAVSSVMGWMTVWDQLHGIPYAPVSRSWVDNYMVRIGFDKSVRGPLTGLWDSFFHAILQSVNDRRLAEANLRVVLDDHALTEEGFPTNYIVSTFKSGDRSQPPIGALAAWKLYRRFGNNDFLAWAYPRLKRWHQWWKTHRDGNADGLLEWGSNAGVRDPGNDAGTLFAAACESGMDNSPLYDEASYDPALGTMNLSDVGLNSLYAADAMFLSRIADALGYADDKRTFDAEHSALSDRINAALWNEQTQAYMDRFWNGRFSARLGPTAFYPLLAGIPDHERAKQLVRRHLLNEIEFWGEFVIPAISKNDPAFRDQLYWRGRIWASVNYLVYLGLKAYRFDDVAFDLALRSVTLFMQEWNLKGHCHENYNAITGEGCDVPIPSSPGSNGSDRFYPWGALLPLMGIEELFDVELDSGIRFGCRFLPVETSVTNVPFGGSVYSIKPSLRETMACRDNKEFFFSSPGVSVRNYTVSGGNVKFAATGEGNVLLRISEFAPHASVAARIGADAPHLITANAQGTISLTALFAAGGQTLTFDIKV
ncbi:hypothetical protein HZA56_19000 [Candidatus Poribacteria bacterium]|nr:hypothetical protein [Candidatus Poribacteria bacterium]